MSRLIVKHLPKECTEKKLRAAFSEYGVVTDCNLKFNTDGKFRQFAFVGYSKPESAEAAIEQLNNTFLGPWKISVEKAKSLSDIKPQLKQAVSQPENLNSSEKTTDKKKSVLGELEEDEKFKEFAEVVSSGKKKISWKNDDTQVNTILKSNSKEEGDNFNKSLAYVFEGESSDEDETVTTKGAKTDDKETDDRETNELAQDKTISDLDYLKKKAGSTSHLSDSDDNTDVKQTPLNTDVKQTPCNIDRHEGNVEEPDNETREAQPEPVEEKVYTVKLKQLPPGVKNSQIKELFTGLTCKFINIPRAHQNKTIGVAYVGFTSNADLQAALRRSRTQMGTKKVIVTTHNDVTNDEQEKTTPAQRTAQTKDYSKVLDDIEPIGESGRLFLRNLNKQCAEEDLEALFKPYGELIDVIIPVDNHSKTSKGIAHIMFMMPEHAVRAHNQLNGTDFQGRLLHILPGRNPHRDENETGAQGGYKQQKNKLSRRQAGSSHNWNSLFLGGNAVADAMSQRYNIDKSQLLAADSDQSLGVRMALGETEIVTETRDFLLDNGVSLDSFSQPAAPRSKTVILVKNLPFGVKTSQLEELFGQHGMLGRVIMPPAGITAIIEFQESTEAKKAFTKLAYKRFEHVPLYLEWAPVGVFKVENTDNAENSEEKNPEVKVQPTEKDDTEQAETEGCTLFVKNLNFKTQDEHLKEHFIGCGTVLSAMIARKRDPKNPGAPLSMGYGFVQYKSASEALTALKQLQHSTLDEHKLELKLSERKMNQSNTSSRKQADVSKKQTGTKILVRNIPFQANQNEITELFKVFGELKLVRLPKKVGGKHRGFAFVDYITKNDAKRAFSALCHSTHLYGRRLVLEWADSAEESVDNLRRKTADSYSMGASPSKVLKRSNISDTLDRLTAHNDE